MFTIYSIIIINKMYLRSLNSARILRKAARALLPRPDQHVEVIEPESYSVMERRKFVVENIANVVGDPSNRLFAVVYVHEKQFKVSQDDIIHLEKNIPLDVGDEIQLEKVLLVGGADFTLMGRPMLNPRYVKVHATVIEKTTTSPDVAFRGDVSSVLHPTWLASELTVLRINGITMDKSSMGHI